MSVAIGTALIARNAGETIGACLDSIRPHVRQIVVGVDETTTDNTAEVARAHGADIVHDVRVSEWHECERHGKVLAQHFGNARNENFSRLDPELDFFLWIDSDDIVKEPEMLAKVGEEVLGTSTFGAWFPYHYGTSNNGQITNTIFHRERLLRTHDDTNIPIRWEWKHRVHENIIPYSNKPPMWLIREQPAIYHQEHGHSADNSSRRNILLLEIDLEANPEDSRAMFYLGNSYFAMGNMPAAIHYYEMLAQYGKSPYELWQAWCYCSMAYQRLGQLDAATGAAFRAIDVEPHHPEPYYRLADIAFHKGRLDMVEYWTQQADTNNPLPPKTMAPFFVFKNPLDYTFNSKMPLADALAAQGKVKEARTILQEAYKALPEPRVAAAIEHYELLERSQEKANSFLHLTETMPDEKVISLWEQIDFDPATKQFGRVRQKVMPLYLKNRRGTTPRIIFFCGRSVEEWSPLSITTTGIGGSETAVIEIAKRFHADGWIVDVYNGAGRYEGIHDGVGYWDAERLTAQDSCDVLVIWRNPKAYNLPIRAGKVILWLHDLNYGPDVVHEMSVWGQTDGARVCGVSQWHADYLRRVYSLRSVDFVPNGIDLSRFSHFTTKERPDKKEFQCVYASSPDRGLERLLSLWPRILMREPGTKLHVAYGWEGVDKAVAMGRQDLVGYKERVLALANQNDYMKNSIVWHGRLNQNDLAKLYAESTVWAYPTHFLEVSCISAMEAMAGACVPVTSTAGALPETLGDAGFLVPGVPMSTAWQDTWVDIFMGVLCSPHLRWPMMHKGMQRAQDFTWDAAYEKWKQVIATLQADQDKIAQEATATAQEIAGGST